MILWCLWFTQRNFTQCQGLGCDSGNSWGGMKRKVFQLGEARMLEEPATLMLKSSKMMAGSGWRASVSRGQSPQWMKGGKWQWWKGKRSVSLNSTPLRKEQRSRFCCCEVYFKKRMGESYKWPWGMKGCLPMSWPGELRTITRNPRGVWKKQSTYDEVGFS